MKTSILVSIRQSFLHVPDSDGRSKIAPRAFIIALVTAMAVDSPKRSIANLRRQFMSSLGMVIARSSFWERMATKRLSDFLAQSIRELVARMAGDLEIDREILGKLGVLGIFLLDSSSITLPKSAKDDFPAPRNNVVPAAVKWHLCWNLLSGIGEWCCLTEAKTHDRKVFPPLEMLKGSLIIFDLGYWDYQLMADLLSHGCYFLSRVKNKALIEITGIPYNEQWKYPLGKNLFSLKWNKYRGDVYELLGTVSLGDSDFADMRIIGFWNPTTKIYQWYVSNLSIPGKLIYPLYRLRWQIELIFKAGKSSLNLSDIPSKNYNIIVNLMLASIITNIIAQPIAKATLDMATKEIHMAMSVQRAGFVFVHVANELMNYLISGKSRAAKILENKLLLYATEHIDPNFKHRPTSLQRLMLLA